MRRPRCGTCRHWVNDEGTGPSFCTLLPPVPTATGSSQPIAANWSRCAQHERHAGRSLKAVVARLCGKPGNDPGRINAAKGAAK